MDVSGKSFIGVVAQKSFETPSAGDTYNSFCTIQPIAFADGTRTTADLFPNNGLVWWMLRKNAHQFATPGQLVALVVQDAVDPRRDDPSGNLYQAVKTSVEPCALDDAVEVLTVPAASIQRPNDLVSRANVLTIDHPPCGMVLVRWRDDIYGPLRVTYAVGDRPGQFSVSLSSPSRGQHVARFSSAQLNALVPESRIFRVEVALDAQVRDRSGELSWCEYELVPTAAYEKLTEMAEGRIILESDSEVLLRAAKRILTRKRRKELASLLKELEEGLAEASPAESPEQTYEVLDRVKRALASDQQQAETLAQALIASGLVDEKIQAGIDGRVEEYIESRAATLQAEIEDRIATKRRELEGLSSERDQQRAALDSQARRAKEKLAKELETITKEERAKLERERADLASRKERLRREEDLLKGRLETVTERLTSARDDVINDFLTLAPLLSQTQLLSRPAAHVIARSEDGAGPKPAPSAERRFTLRSYLSAAAPATEELSELDFFERFVEHTKTSGYVYRRLDLASFHVSAKTSDLTVLGGVSGTGKSSLPRLYAEALAGSDDAGSSRYQLVGVNPSWLDVGDLLGRVNALDARFQPSESGLYSLLIHAHEEYGRWASDSGIYLVCLDEMNLAHVEHYFSSFLQVMESPPAHRHLRCFAPEVVSPESDFSKWATLSLPPSLRFVGTVNFDETTKPLSLRVLDRVNLIKLRPGRLSELDLSTVSPIAMQVEGPPVTSTSYESWMKSAQPGREVAELLDELRAPLADLGCPLSPRRYRSLCQFLASAPAEILTPVQALDLQIAQRLLPQIRGLFRREAQEAFKTLVSLLEKRDADFRESLQALEELGGGDYQLAPDLVE